MNGFPNYFSVKPVVEELPTGADYTLPKTGVFVSLKCTPPFTVTLKLNTNWSQTFTWNDEVMRWDQIAVSPIYFDTIRVDASVGTFELTYNNVIPIGVM
jgi:hypothetical protein